MRSYWLFSRIGGPLCALVLAAVFTAQTVHAEEAEATEAWRDDARRLANEAADRYEERDYEAALDLFQRARKLYDAPTLGLWEARCLEQLGRLVEAEARYTAVSRTELAPDAPEAYAKAQQEANDALTELRKRLPTISIIIKGADNVAKVQVDDRELPEPLVGAPVAVDPGTHTVKVTLSSGEVETESVAIVESQAQEVEVHFAPKTPASPPAELDTLMDTEEPTEQPADWTTPLGWTALAVGGLGVGTGVFAGLRANSKHDVLKKHCPDGGCPPPYHSELDEFRSLRTVSTIGYVVGAVGLGAGAVLLLTAEGHDDAMVYLSPTGASFRSSF